MRGHLKVRFIYIDCAGLIPYGLDLRILPALRYASVVLARCVSVCLSQVGVLTKRMDGSSWLLAWKLCLSSL